MEIKNNTPEEILTTIDKSNNILICMDARFDFDALCSVTIMHKFLDNRNVKHKVYFDREVPENTKNLIEDYSFITQNTHPNTIDMNKFDTMIFLDSGELQKISYTGVVNPIPAHITKICIDHHTLTEDFADLYYSHKSMSTTTQLYKLFKAWDIEITSEIYYLMLLGLITDSGFFSHRFEHGVGTVEFKLASEAIQSGVDYPTMIHNLNFYQPYEELLLRKLVYKNMVYDKEHKCIYTYISNQDLLEEGITSTTNLSSEADMLKYVDGINFAFSIKDYGEPNAYKASLRSHEYDFDVEKVAVDVGVSGGGHRVASGCKIMGENIDEVINKILFSAKKHNPNFY